MSGSPDASVTPARSASIEHGGIRRKLLRSHLVVGLLGVALLIVCLGSILFLRASATRLALVRGPTVRHSMAALSGVHHSLAALRGWVVVDDPVFQADRAAAWRDEIRPAVNGLETLIGSPDAGPPARPLEQLRATLHDLEEWQWWIEDVARTPGNEPAQVIYLQNVEPIANQVQEGITAMIAIARVAPPAAPQSRLVAGLMSDFRFAMARSQAELVDFLARGDSDSEDRCRAAMEAASARLRQIAAWSSALDREQQEILAWLREEFTAYVRYSGSAIAIRKTPQWNIAQHMFVTRVDPVARTAIDRLSAWSASQNAAMQADAARVARISNATSLLALALLASMALAAYGLARRGATRLTRPIAALALATDELAAGRLTRDIPVTSADELGRLTQAFNRMRARVREGEDALRKAHDELQRRVEERTAELSRTNEILRTEIVEREQGEQSLQRYAARLQTLQEVDRTILGARSPNAVKQAALHHLRTMVSCARASIALFDATRGQLVVQAVDASRSSLFDAGSHPPPNGFSEGLDHLRSGQVWKVPDTLDLPRTPLVEALLAAGIRSSVSIPLISQGQLIGTLNMGWDTPRAFSDESIAIASEVATSVTIGMEQARLNEEVTRHAAELETRVADRTAELEAFSYSVSHDLRVPLRAIAAFSRIVIDEHSAGLDAEGHRLLRTISSSAETMRQLIDGLLALSRLGSQPMALTTIDLAAMTREVFEDLRSAIPGRDMRFVIGDLSPAYGDPTMIRQVLVNLLDNAIKFTAVSAAPVIAVGQVPDRGGPIYYVKDNGAGFDERYADRLFGVFQRLHRQDEFEGSGVGLAIVRRIIHRHGGRIWARGREGLGATFYFTIPSDRESPTYLGAPSSESVASPSMTAGDEMSSASVSFNGPSFEPPARVPRESR